MSITENFVQYAFREKLTEEELDDYVRSKFTEGLTWQTSVEKLFFVRLSHLGFYTRSYNPLLKKMPIPML